MNLADHLQRIVDDRCYIYAFPNGYHAAVTYIAGERFQVHVPNLPTAVRDRLGVDWRDLLHATTDEVEAKLAEIAALPAQEGEVAS